MSNPIAQTVRLLEQELEVTEARCGELARAIETLRPLAGPDEDDEAEEDVPAVPRRRKKAVKPKKAAKRETAAADVTDKGAAILAALKKHGSPMSPGELVKALKLGSTSTLLYQLKPLVKAKQIVVTGKTAGRRVSLPGARAAKEGP